MALEAHESPDGLISPAESPPLISAVAGARPWKLCLATPIFPGPQPVLSGQRGSHVEGDSDGITAATQAGWSAMAGAGRRALRPREIGVGVAGGGARHDCLAGPNGRPPCCEVLLSAHPTAARVNCEACSAGWPQLFGHLAQSVGQRRAKTPDLACGRIAPSPPAPGRRFVGVSPSRRAAWPTGAGPGAGRGRLGGCPMIC